MRNLSSFPKIYLYTGRVDFRKSIDGLSILVQSELKENVFDGHLFLFLSRCKKKIKLLYWDKSGFAFWYKRLDKEKFPFPKLTTSSKLEVSNEDVEWLLSGVDIWKISKHKALDYTKIY